MPLIKWIPDESNDVISPWGFGMYFGLTLVLMAIIGWRWSRWSKEQARNAEEEINKAVGGDISFIV